MTGQWFHSFTDAGKVQWQGQVLDNPEPNLYLVQLYEWFGGSPSDQKLVHIEDMDGWAFYGSHEDMNLAYEQFVNIGLAE